MWVFQMGSINWMFRSTQYGSYSRSVIAKAMNEYHTKTCIRFVPRDARKHRDFIYIHPDDGKSAVMMLIHIV